MDIDKDSVVRILSAAYPFWNKYGVVDRVKGAGDDITFRVKFGLGVETRAGSPSECWFKRTDLEALSEMPSEARVEYLYGKHGYHSLYQLRHPFDERSTCHHRAHDGESVAPRAVKRLLLNAWGAVCEFDACEAHTDMEKVLYEELPWSKRSTPTT